MSKMRTASGKPSAAARRKYGVKGGRYPIFDRKSALSALRLRHHSKAVSAKSVIRRVMAWARRHNDSALLAKARAAMKKDSSKE